MTNATTAQVGNVVATVQPVEQNLDGVKVKDALKARYKDTSVLASLTSRMGGVVNYVYNKDDAFYQVALKGEDEVLAWLCDSANSETAREALLVSYLFNEKVNAKGRGYITALVECAYRPRALLTEAEKEQASPASTTPKSKAAKQPEDPVIALCVSILENPHSSETAKAAAQKKLDARQLELLGM